MMHDFDPMGVGRDIPAWDANEVPVIQEVPRQLDVLPDGREVLVIGNPEGCKEFTHKQGDNPYGFQGTSAIPGQHLSL